MDRHDLSKRRRTGDGYGVRADWRKKRLMVVNEISELRLKYGILIFKMLKSHSFYLDIQNSHVINTDETAVFFDLVSPSTVDYQGAKCVKIKFTGKEKSRVTAMVAGALSGDMLMTQVAALIG